jgi:hypothetical protein
VSDSNDPTAYLWARPGTTILSAEALADLFSDTLSDRDVHGSVDVVRMLMADEAFPSLLCLLNNDRRSWDLRMAAASAICEIGQEPIREQLEAFLNSTDSALRILARQAVGNSAQ